MHIPYDKKYFTVIVAPVFGLISATLSYYAFGYSYTNSYVALISRFLGLSMNSNSYAEIHLLPTSIPGILFGLLLCIYIFMIKRLRLHVGWILFIALSGVASLVAFFTTYYSMLVALSQRFSSSPNMVLELATPFIGGICGSFVLLIAFHFIIQTLSIKKFLGLILLGGILGMSLLLPQVPSYSSSLFPLPLLLVWQTGMMVAFSFVIKKSSI